MITTPSMGLKRWDQPNDVFSYTELSDNFATLDAHDHTTGKGVQVPTGGIANLAITEPKLANDAVTANKIATDAVTAAKIPNASLADSKLASPSSGVWRTLARVNFFTTALAWIPTSYLLGGSALIASGVAGTVAPLLIPFDPAQYAVAGKTTALRVYVVGTTNATASTSNFTFNLLSVSSSAGGAGQITTNTGASASPNATVTTPAASTVIAPFSSAEFTPVSNTYVLGVSINQSMAANSAVTFSVYLQLRHV